MVDDESTDLAIAVSVFTHLFEEDARNYLLQMGRVLRECGLLVASIHTEPKLGDDYSGTEIRIDVRPDHLIELAAS